MKKVEQVAINFIDENELLVKSDKVLIALSGGPDSVFLLHFLNKFKKRFSIDIVAYHLNHQIRGKAADKDVKFCKALCSNLNIPFSTSSINIKKIAADQKISIEEAGRNTRYSELQRIAQIEGISKIATAHIANDNAETVLLNLIKGTGLKGISGIPVKRGNIIRPILSLSKKEILEYLDKKNIPYRQDKSNLTNDYERNFIRNKIIPLITKRLNPSFEKTVLNSSKNFRNYLNHFEEGLHLLAQSVSEFNSGILKINIKAILKKDELERTEITKLLLERNFYAQVTFKDVNKILSLMKKETGTKINISGKLIAARERDKVFIFKDSVQKKSPPLTIKAGEKIKLNGNILFIKPENNLPEIFSNNRSVEYISADNLEENFILRRWKSGDRFYPLGLKGSKKISDFLNEQKIISVEKKDQLVLTNAGKIIWVIGLRIDDRFKITNSTKKVFQLCLI